MNFIANFFSALAVIMLISGTLINYCTNLMPEIVVKLFRYGRANISKSSGSLQKIEIPKRWFWHFYLWAVSLQLFVVGTIFSGYTNASSDLSTSWVAQITQFMTGKQNATVSATATLIAVLLFQFHLTRRLLETLFVSVFSGTKMNVSHYSLGFLHYTFAIISLVASSPGIASETSRKGYALSINDISLMQWLGVCIFFYGNYQQYLAHKGFANLRKGKDNKIATKEHKIPRGGLFELISCPNYWAEMVIYVGLTLILGIQNYTWHCCTVWVIVNQITAGVMNHKWYLEKWGSEYPKERKAVIPYIY